MKEEQEIPVIERPAILSGLGYCSACGDASPKRVLSIVTDGIVHAGGVFSAITVQILRKALRFATHTLNFERAAMLR